MSAAPLELAPLPGLSRPLRLITHPPQRDLVSARLHAERRWEPFETQLLLACMRPGAVACDVGANLGYFSVAFALADKPPSAVYAFEPAAENFDLLQRNLQLNACADRVIAEHAALAEAAGSAPLHLSDDNLGDHQLQLGTAPRRSETVTLLCGDAYFASRAPRLDVLKIDTQGTEMAVIAGLRNTLHASRVGLHLMLELTPYSLRQAGSSGRALISAVAELDLPLAIIDHLAGRLVPETAESLARWCDNVDATPGDEGFMNIFIGEAPPAFR